MPEDKLHDFYATSISGFEEVVLDDLKSHFPGASRCKAEKGGRQGRIFFRFPRSPRRLLELRSATNIFGLLTDFRAVTPGQPGLRRLCTKIGQLNLHAARNLLAACRPDADPTRFHLQVSLRGRHRFSRQDLRRAVCTTLEQSHGLIRARGRDVLRLDLKVIDRRALFGVQLAGRRSPGRIEREGLTGPLAFCLGRLLGLSGWEVVVLCSGGVDALTEISHSGPPRLLVGCQLDSSQWKHPEPDNTPPSTPGVNVIITSSCNIPIATSSADCVIAVGARDLPSSGRQVLREYARILRPNGLAMILTSLPAELVQLLLGADLPFEIAATQSILLGGRRYSLFALERLDLLSLG